MPVLTGFVVAFTSRGIGIIPILFNMPSQYDNFSCDCMGRYLMRGPSLSDRYDL